MVKLTKSQLNRREQLIEFGERYVNEGAAERDAGNVFDKELWTRLSELNLHGVFVDEKIGGLGLSMADGMSMLESMGYAFRDNGLSFAMTAQLLSCSASINKFGSKEQRQQILSPVVTGEKIIAHAITETGSGSDAFNMHSTYTKNSDGSVKIDGSKRFISNLPVSDYILCYLRNSGNNANSEISSFLIAREHLTDILTIGKMGLNYCRMGSVNFNTNIEGSNMLGKEGTGKMIFNESMMLERMGMSALHLGTVERLLQECIKWTNERTSNGRKLSELQSISHTLVDIHNNWTVLRNHLYSICAEDLSYTKRYMQSAILNDKACELYVEACKEILQIYGGLGYTKLHEIERMMRDALGSKIYSGTSRIQREIVWKFIS